MKITFSLHFFVAITLMISLHAGKNDHMPFKKSNSLIIQTINDTKKFATVIKKHPSLHKIKEEKDTNARNEITMESIELIKKFKNKNVKINNN